MQFYMIYPAPNPAFILHLFGWLKVEGLGFMCRLRQGKMDES